MKFQWVNGCRFSGSAQKTGERIEALRRKNGGAITADVVVFDAKSEKSPLHSHFEWDDRSAAREYRLEQGRLLLRSVLVILDESPEPTRAFVHLTVAEPDYHGIVSVMRDKDLRERLLAEAYRELKEFERKYRHLRELAKVFSAIRSLKGVA